MAKKTTTAAPGGDDNNKKKTTEQKKAAGARLAELLANADKQRIVVDADLPLTLNVANENIENGECGDPAKCVMGLAIADHFGPHVLDGWSVGTSISKLVTPTHIIRYSTPHRVSVAVRVFDATGHWGLPAGQYTLKPLSKSYRREGRWEKKKNSGTRPRDYHNGISAPTRFSPTVSQINAGKVSTAKKK